MHWAIPRPLRVTAFEIGTRVLEEGIFPDDTFVGLLAIFQEEKFQHSDGSWKLVRVFEDNWEQLSEEQRRTLLPVLESNYESFSEWMACFIISGILGELYRNAPSFEVLQRLARCRKEVARSLVPHGLEHIVRDTPDTELATRASAELARMQTDHSPTVRNEVAESMARIIRAKRQL